MIQRLFVDFPDHVPTATSTQSSYLVAWIAALTMLVISIWSLTHEFSLKNARLTWEMQNAFTQLARMRLGPHLEGSRSIGPAI